MTTRCLASDNRSKKPLELPGTNLSSTWILSSHNVPLSLNIYYLNKCLQELPLEAVSWATSFVGLTLL
uniref:Uncharacterized protein n=1 Tax=Salix viminalis TaxID=40686 RepID=A0A6N2M9X4_SALVM